MTAVPTVWRGALLLALLSAALAVIASSDALHDVLLQVLAVVGTLITAHPLLGATAFVALSAVSAMVAFFSAAFLVPVAVYAWGNTISIALLWLGWTVGGICAYGLGRTLGRPVVTLLVSAAALERFESRITRHVPFGFVLLFQLAVPSEVPGYLLGLVRYPPGKFLLALGIAELPFAAATVSGRQLRRAAGRRDADARIRARALRGVGRPYAAEEIVHLKAAGRSG